MATVKMITLSIMSFILDERSEDTLLSHLEMADLVKQEMQYELEYYEYVKDIMSYGDPEHFNLSVYIFYNSRIWDLFRSFEKIEDYKEKLVEESVEHSRLKEETYNITMKIVTTNIFKFDDPL